MDGLTILWIVVALAVLVILVALLAWASRRSSKRRAEQEEQEAYEARASAARAEKQQAAADEQPAGKHWADGHHPDDPRRQPWPETDQRQENERHNPKHSRH